MPAPRWSENCSAAVFARLLRTISATWRVDCVGCEALDELARFEHRHILAFWHRHYLALFRLLRSRPAIALTNTSHRGRIIAGICERSGMRALQVHNHGTKELLESLESAVNEGLGLGIAVDGPLGPAFEVKRAVLHLAARLDCRIVPVSVAADHKRRFNSRWDGLEIPHLFSRVTFVIGDALTVSPRTSRTDLRETALQLKHALEQGTIIAEQRVRSARFEPLTPDAPV